LLRSNRLAALNIVQAIIPGHFINGNRAIAECSDKNESHHPSTAERGLHRQENPLYDDAPAKAWRQCPRISIGE
jgi:hypothetical protein